MLNTKNFTVIITRAKKQSIEFENALKALGFNTLCLPSIEIFHRKKCPENYGLLDKIDSGYFNWLIFTSANAVEALHEMQKEAAAGPLIPPETKLAVIGDKTAKTLNDIYGTDAVLKPKKFISESLIEEFKNFDLKKSKLLLVAASKTRDIIKPALEKEGSEVSILTAYDNIEMKADPQQIMRLYEYEQGSLVFTFFSPSAVNSTINMLGDSVKLLNQSTIISIGPITSKALNERGFKVSFESADHSEEGVLTILNKYVSLDNK